jgi:DNA gyrase subunit A
MSETKPTFVPIDIEQEMRRSYLDYAMSVIIGRALPDVRDGLKPVHRRILYAMHEMNLIPGRKHSKCAGVVGEVLKKYHPHGDAPVYEALVRMAQGFNMRYPLIDGQGNFGSIDGDPPAAYRYTECRLAAIAMSMLADIEKETIDFTANFDETTQEPAVLPTRAPNLLVNGSSGIAVGMATNIPPHNLTEVLDACAVLIQKPDAKLEEVMKLIPGPDFPTGAFICGREGIEQAYRTGRGTFQMRAKAAVERVSRDRENIVITEIPYQVNKAKLIERIAELVQDKTLEGVADIRDESDREGLRIVIELKKDEEPKIILNQLYKRTQMQESFGVILLAIVNGQPREMGLIELLQHFIEHRVEVVRRRTTFDLKKAEDREHILLGFKKALDVLDAVIKLIRSSKSPKEAKEGLIARWEFTERQAQAILDLQLHRLTQMEREKILEELKQIEQLIAELKEILASEKKLKHVIVNELREVQKQFGDERRTQIVERVEEIKLEDLIADEDVAITVSHAGYVKRTPVAVYRHQSRGGKGRIGMKTREEDFVEDLFIASTHSYLLIFTNKGRVYWLKVYEVPDVSAAGRGKPIVNLVGMSHEEKVTAVLAVRNLEEPGKYVFMATKNGTVKKTELIEFSNPRASGIIAMGLEDGDELIGVELTGGKHQIFLASHDGMAIRFDEDDVRAMGRPAYGVKGMELEKDDYLVSMEAIPEDSGLILSVTEKGYGKRTELSEYRRQSRGGKGVINVKTTERNGRVVGALHVEEESDMMLITEYGKVIRLEASEVRAAGRSTQGVRLLRLGDEDSVAAATVVPAEAPTNGGDNAGASPATAK